MIASALNFLLSELDAHLRARFQIAEPCAVLGHPADIDGPSATQMRRGVLLSLVGLRHGAELRQAPSSEGGGRPPSPLELQLLVSVPSLPGGYLTALGLLESAIEFFQAHPRFGPEDFPHLPPELTRLTVESLALDVGEQGALWNGLGARYRPSMVYRVRLAGEPDDALGGLPTVG